MARFRLMTWNLLDGGRGEAGNRLDLVAAVIRAARPDVLVACEANGLAEDARLATDLAGAVGMRIHVAPADTGSHVALLTRAPVQVTHFEASETGGSRRAALAVLRIPGLPDLVLAGCHLDATSAGTRLAEILAILARLPRDRPRLLMGDLNQMSHEDGLSRRDLLELPLHHVERHVGSDGEPDTRALRAITDAGLVDAWRLAHAGEAASAGHTVPTAIPQPPRFSGMRIDYVFLSADLPAALTWCEAWREKPAPRASDHFPVVADVEPHGIG